VSRLAELRAVAIEAISHVGALRVTRARQIRDQLREADAVDWIADQASTVKAGDDRTAIAAIHEAIDELEELDAADPTIGPKYATRIADWAARVAKACDVAPV
jgi:hypothetical protein